MVFYLIDGNGFCYRAFHAIRDLRNSRGEPTNVVYGFCVMLKKLLDDFKPDGIAVTFDSKGPTFRHEKFAEYKSHRKPMPDDLAAQMPVVKRLVEAFRIPVFEKQGFEADDLLGTLARQIEAKGHETVIVTGDKDMLQLVNDKVKVMNPQKDFLVYDAAGVKERFGVDPAHVADVLALMGDSSDYIPGVAGIGEKTALELVREFGTLERILENTANIPQDARRRALIEHRDDAVLSKELATIDRNAPIEFKSEELKAGPPDSDALRGLFRELEFRSFLKDLPREKKAAAAAADYGLVATEAEWRVLLRELERAQEFAFDFETTGTDAMTVDPVGVSFSTRPHAARFVLFRRHVSGRSALDAGEVLRRMKRIFEDPSVKKIGQNIKYEMTILRRFGIRLRGVGMDTMVGSYLLNSSKRNHNLAELASEYLDEDLIAIESLIGKGRAQITMAEADLDSLVRYGCQDSDVALRLAAALGPRIGEKGMSELLSRIDLPLVEVLCDMETTGIAIDKPFLVKLGAELGREIAKLTRNIHKAAGGEFNINSPKQLSEILFIKLGLPPLRKTKTGVSTDVEVLSELAELHEVPKLVLEYRELMKLKSTYVDTMPGMANPVTGRIHTSYNQAVTETGRLSSNEPNLQNIPVRTEEGRRIRKAFVAGEGNVFLSADYSQIELRVLAHFSGDETLKKAFREEQDVHAYTAGLIFGVAPAEVTPKMRETAKTVNFGVIYGMSPFGLSKALKISQEAARDFIRSYFERYPGVKRFLDGTIEEARAKGFVETLFKRRRYIPDISSSDARVRQYAERTATNAPLQGTASDLIKLAMIALARDLEEFGGKVRMLLQVHDELLFELEEGLLGRAAAMVRRDMAGAATLDVPLRVTLKSGPNWMDLERLEEGAPAVETGKPGAKTRARADKK